MANVIKGIIKLILPNPNKEEVYDISAKAANITSDTGALAYYSDNIGTFANDTNVLVLNKTADLEFTYSATTSINGVTSTYTTTAATGRELAGDIKGLLIRGTNYGNIASYLASNEVGVFSFGDPGPLIQFAFAENNTYGRGALLYTNHNGTGIGGSSFHFLGMSLDLSEGGEKTGPYHEAPVNVVSDTFIAKEGIVVGTNRRSSSATFVVKSKSLYNTGFYDDDGRIALIYKDDNKSTLWLGNNGAVPSSGRLILQSTFEQSKYTVLLSSTTAENNYVYLPAMTGTMYLTHVANNSAVGGSTTTPVYVAENGRITAMSAISVDLINTATTASNGLMSSSDKTKINKINDTLTASLAIVTDSNGNIIAKNLAVSSPSASGTDTSFITTISQDSLGKISATKASLPIATSSINGIGRVTGNNGIDVSYSSGVATVKHSNSITANNSYSSSATTLSANGGKLIVRDFKYDALGHITGVLDREITLSQVDNNTDTKVNVKTRGTTKAYLLATTTLPTSSNTAVESVAETGVYLDTTVGKLVANSFSGDDITLSTTKLAQGANLLTLNDISSGTSVAYYTFRNDSFGPTQNLIDLGSSAYKWRNLYFSGNIDNHLIPNNNYNIGIYTTTTGTNLSGTAVTYINSVTAWNNLLINDIRVVPFTGSTELSSAYSQYVRLYRAAAGTTATVGIGRLILGNPSTTANGANNAYGDIWMYSAANTYHQIYATEIENSRTHFLPKYSGWFVTTSGTSNAAGSTTKPVYITNEGLATAVSAIDISLIPTGTTSATVAIGNHTHTTSLVLDTSASNNISLSHGSKYKLTTGETSVVFTMPSDNNTTYTFAGGTNQFTVTPSGGTAQSVTVTPSITNNVTHSVGAVTANHIVTWNANAGSNDNAVIKDSGVTISTTVPSSSSTDTTLPTSSAVWSAISNAYTVGNKALKIASNSGTSSTAITVNENSNDKILEIKGDGTYLSGAITTGTNKVIVTITPADSGVTSASYGLSENATPNYGGTFNVPYFTVDNKGRVTSATTHTVKIPISDNTDEKVKQTSSSTSTNYKLLFTTSASPTSGAAAETYYNTNLQYNPGTNILSTGNLNLSGNLSVTGNTTLNNNVTINAPLTTNSLIVNGNSSFSNSISINNGLTLNNGYLILKPFNSNYNIENSTAVGKIFYIANNSSYEDTFYTYSNLRVNKIFAANATFNNLPMIGNLTLLLALGLSNALHFIGITSTTMTDGMTAANVTINDATHTPQIGDVVLYDHREYVWTSTSTNGTWEMLGSDASIMSSSGTSNNAANIGIIGISLSSDGTISATTGNLVLGLLASWTNGTTNGPILSVTVNGVNTTATIPVANDTLSGVVTTDSLTFKGNKTFNDNIVFNGTISSNVIPTTNNNVSLGSETNSWGSVYSYNNFRLRTFTATTAITNGWNQYGRLYINAVGSSTTVGSTRLILGNPGDGTSSENKDENNSQGFIFLYSKGKNYVAISNLNTTTNTNVYIPNYNGNMYLTHTGNANSLGSDTLPVYVAENGRITAVSSINTNLIATATASVYGITRLSSATNSTVENVAATPAAVNAAYQAAISAANNSAYAGSILTTSAATYNTEPEVKSVKINGSTTSATTSTTNVLLIFDTSLKVLNFVFS